MDAIPRAMEPVPFVAGEQLYGMREGRMQLITSNADDAEPEARRAVRSATGLQRRLDGGLARNTDLAVVTDGRTVLRARRPRPARWTR